ADLASSGNGTRLIWNPKKAALRVGTVSGTQWDLANIGDNSNAFGSDSIASARFSSAFGSETSATGMGAFAAGMNVVASDFAATAFGSGVTAGGFGNFVAGVNSSSSGYGSVAIGYSASSSGSQSVAVGSNAVASNFASIAFMGGTASGQYSLAHGNSAVASGQYSIAIGSNNSSSNTFATTIGNYNTASMNFATAIGYQNIASGTFSHSYGSFTTSESLAQTSLGFYNLPTTPGTGGANNWVATDPILVVGNGSDANAKSTALTILKNGKVGINTVAPTERLDVVGNIKTSGCLYYASSSLGTCASDSRIKKDVHSFNLGLEALLGIKPVNFKYNGLAGFKEDGIEQLGVIAQDLEKSAPQLIHKKMVQLNKNDNVQTEIKVVDYGAFTFVIINAIKDFYKEWIGDSERLRREVASLKNLGTIKEKEINELKLENQAIKMYLCEKDPKAKICHSKESVSK
ncbi:MAG: tail fiber domain-containing protein, partial [Bdellovibrionales bacterium]|nr:tail fiber domain-containing protein [Bdellovibrionales bacterium]